MSYTQNAKASRCPAATKNIVLNLANRQRCIDDAEYGPANPGLKNEKFWKKKAKIFGSTVEEAQTMRCGNCAAFNVSPRILRCIADGIHDEGVDEYDMIEAGHLGYCQMFQFKCAAARTCNAWIYGGPIRR